MRDKGIGLMRKGWGDEKDNEGERMTAGRGGKEGGKQGQETVLSLH